MYITDGTNSLKLKITPQLISWFIFYMNLILHFYSYILLIKQKVNIKELICATCQLWGCVDVLKAQFASLATAVTSIVLMYDGLHFNAETHLKDFLKRAVTCCYTCFLQTEQLYVDWFKHLYFGQTYSCHILMHTLFPGPHYKLSCVILYKRTYFRILWFLQH